MSYGRKPFYIYRSGTDDGKSEFNFYGDMESAAHIPYDAMAQFIAALQERPDELAALGERGRQVRREASSCNYVRDVKDDSDD